VTTAAGCPGKALAVALAVWYRAGRKKCARVKLSLATLDKQMGIKRDAARRGLAALERAGLVTVERRVGARPQVTLLQPPLAEIEDD
jgi:hypothetical protein